MPAAIAPIGPLAQESPYIVGVALKRPKKKKKKKEKEKKELFFKEKYISFFSFLDNRFFFTLDCVFLMTITM